jgi:hypothetical protein
MSPLAPAFLREQTVEVANRSSDVIASFNGNLIA